MADIYDMAFAELKLTEEEFWSMPPFRTYLMQMAYNREIDRKWEQTRFIAMMIHNTSMGKKKNVTVQQIIKLPFDSKRSEAHPQWTPEEAQKLIDAWSEPTGSKKEKK